MKMYAFGRYYYILKDCYCKDFNPGHFGHRIIIVFLQWLLSA